MDGPVVSLVSVEHFGSYLLHELSQVLSMFLDVLATVEEVTKFLLVECNFVSLLLQVAGHNFVLNASVVVFAHSGRY